MSEKTSDDAGLFSPTILGFLVASVVAIFALSVVLATIGGTDTPFRTTAASPSAIGHKGFYTLLQRLDMPVSLSRIDDRVFAGTDDLLILDEPERRFVSFGRGIDGDPPPNALLILPKWTGEQDLLHDGWVRNVELLDPDVPRHLLQLIDPKGIILREPAPAAWVADARLPAPKIDDKVQVIAHSGLKPLIGTKDRVLLGELAVNGRRIWVLADPDPIENHGIAAPANTRFALALVQALRTSGQIVFDETVHGTIAPDRNILQLLFRFPFVIVTIEVLIALALLLLATTTRFGGTEAAPAPFPLGKTRLVETIATLMDRAGHQPVILRRYISMMLGETGRALHAPHDLDDDALAAWLDRAGSARGLASKPSAVLQQTQGDGGGRAQLFVRLLDQARAIYAFNRDMTDGSGGRQDHR